MIRVKYSIAVQPQHLRDVAIILRDVAHAHRRVDEDRPDRGDEDHEDGGGLPLPEAPPATAAARPEAEWCAAPGRSDPAPRMAKRAAADQHAQRDAHDRSEEIAEPDALEEAHTCQNRPLSMPPLSKNGFDDEPPRVRHHLAERRKPGSGRRAEATSQSTQSGGASMPGRRRHGTSRDVATAREREAPWGGGPAAFRLNSSGGAEHRRKSGIRSRLDGQGSPGRPRVGRVEHLAVEEGLHARGCRSAGCPPPAHPAPWPLRATDRRG